MKKFTEILLIFEKICKLFFLTLVIDQAIKEYLNI